MVKEEIYLKLFGTIRLEINGTEINLEKKLGDQLSRLFALFVYNHNQPLSKEKLINEFWSNSEDPANALKYAIYRLRNTIKKIPEMADKEWIVTTENEYQLNNELDIVLDFEEFEGLISKAKETSDYEKLQRGFDLYQEDFLCNFSNDWILLNRGFYQLLYYQAAENLCQYYLDSEKLNECIIAAKKALSLDAFHEEIVYYYIKALILEHKYNAALTYYNEISKKFYSELGIGLQPKTKELLNIISSKDTDKKKTNINEFHTNLIEGKTFTGPFRCDVSNFKSIAQFEIRNSIRNKQKKYILLLDIKGKEDSITKAREDLLKLVAISLRMNDVYTVVNSTQIVILLNLRDSEDAYIIVKRIIAKFKISQRDVQVDYKVKNIISEEVYREIQK